MFGRKVIRFLLELRYINGKFKNFKSDIFIAKITCAPVADKPLLCVTLMSNNGDSAAVSE